MKFLSVVLKGALALLVLPAVLIFAPLWYFGRTREWLKELP